MKIAAPIILILIIAVVGLGAGYLSLSQEIATLKTQKTSSDYLLNPTVQEISESITKAEVEDIVSGAIATLSSKPKVTSAPTPRATAAPAKQNSIVFIPLGGSDSTQSTDWIDAKNAEVWLDFNGEYGKLAEAWWDAFLKVENSNGTAYARLFDVTHGIAVDGSEINVANTDKFTQASSSKLKLWQGRNLYRVQIKSLNSFPIYLDSARIKISY